MIIKVLMAPEAVFCFWQQNAKEHNRKQGAGSVVGGREEVWIVTLFQRKLLFQFTPDHKLGPFIDSFTGCFPLFLPGDSQ